MRKLKKNKLFHGGETVAINNIHELISLIEAYSRDNKCDRYFIFILQILPHHIGAGMCVLRIR